MIAVLVALSTLALAPPAPPAREVEVWDPARTWVFVASVLVWEHADTWEPFPAEGRRDVELVRLLRARGVLPERVVVVRDAAATRARLEAELAALVARVPPGDVLLLFFAGHGHRDGPDTWLVPHDCGDDVAAGGWSTRAIVDQLARSFRGRAVLLAVDGCHSGALLADAASRELPFAVGGVASAAPRCTSTARWTFTDLLLDGLRGSRLCDADGDGAVTLGELGRHVEGGMAWLEEQMAPYHAGWDPVLAPATRAPPPRAGERLEVLQDERWYRALVHRAAAPGDPLAGQLLVHYAGWGCVEDEWVGPERVRPWRAPDHAAGDAVLARRGGAWREAVVLDVRHGLVRVRFADRPRSRGAWLAPARVRRAGEPPPGDEGAAGDG